MLHNDIIVQHCRENTGKDSIMEELPLAVTFVSPSLDERLKWLNPPPRWEVDPEDHTLVIYPGGKTDFWQQTHYRFRADNGHLLCAQISGDWELSTSLVMKPRHQYDQAGLMVRVSPACWLKTSIEYECEEPAQLGVVVTNHGFSDWSTQNFSLNGQLLHFRLLKHRSDYMVFFADGNNDEKVSWQRLRITHLHHRPFASVLCGIYCCSPREEGFEARFFHFTLQPVS